MRRTAFNRASSQQGFTLVEMAVVLVIIGLIIGSVTIGKDIQRNAEYTKIKQKFIDQWVVSYNAYYQRVGAPIGDDQTRPRLMVNGANFNSGTTRVSGGNMTGVQEPNAICEGGAPDVPGARGAQGAPHTLRALIERVGIRMPPGRAEGAEDRYVYLDTNGNPQEIQVCFQWNRPGTPSGSGNVMIISGLTPDLARTLDQMIDGKPDAREGVFRQSNISNGTGNDAGVEWGGNNTQTYGANASADGNGIVTGERLDEAQVMVVTAHYKMNQ